MILALLFALIGTTGTGMALLAVEEGEGPLAGIITAEAAGGVELGVTRAELVRSDDDDDDDRGRYVEHEDGDDEEVIEAFHSAFVYFTLTLVALHIFGVIASSFAHGENLVRAMITGRKPRMD